MPQPRLITFGEVMARLAAPGFQRFPQAMPGSLDVTFTGAEANVAAAVAQWGADAAFVTALPQHEVADAAIANLRAHGVDTRHIVRSPHGRLGLFYLEQGVNQRPARVIYDREGSSVALLKADVYDWAAAFADGDWFHLSGITPALSANAAQVALYALREAKKRKLRVSFDMNFRSKLWGWQPGIPPRDLAARTVRELLPFVDLFIGGPDDIALLTGESFVGEETRALTARSLTAKFSNISRVAMTVRETVSASHHRLGGMLYEAAEDQAHFAPQRGGGVELYDMPHMVDRLGGGDAFAAGLIFALLTPQLAAPQTALEFATAASCLAHSVPGDFALVSRAEIESLMQGGSKAVNRQDRSSFRRPLPAGHRPARRVHRNAPEVIA